MTSMLRVDVAELAEADIHQLELVATVLNLDVRGPVGPWLDVQLPEDGPIHEQTPARPSPALVNALEALVVSLRAGEAARADEGRVLGRMWGIDEP